MLVTVLGMITEVMSLLSENCLGAIDLYAFNFNDIINSKNLLFKMCGVGGYAMPIHEHRIVLPLLLGRGATVPLVDGAEAVRVSESHQFPVQVLRQQTLEGIHCTDRHIDALEVLAMSEHVCSNFSNRRTFECHLFKAIAIIKDMLPKNLD